MSLPFKVLSVGVPAAIVDGLTYPLQRAAILLSKWRGKENHIAGESQMKATLRLIRDMAHEEGFPKAYQGLRFSMDYSVTQMVSKFILFDWLVEKTPWTANISEQSAEKRYLLVSAYCLSTTVLSTFISQSALNFQILAGSFKPSKSFQYQRIRDNLKDFAANQKPMTFGLKWSMGVGLVTSAYELAVIWLARSLRYGSANQTGSSHLWYALPALILTVPFPLHFLLQRAIEEVHFMPRFSIPFKCGLVANYIRHVSRMSLLVLIYGTVININSSSDHLKSERAINHHKLPEYRE